MWKPIPSHTFVRRLIVWLSFGLLVSSVALAQQPAGPAQPPVREIKKLAGEVYRFRNNNHYSVFAVTPAGVIATDPINAEAAQWLKDEIKKRWNQPIKYVVYSHDHADHISGGQVFDGAVIVAHELAREAIVGEKRPTAVPNVTFTSGTLAIELGGTVAEVTYLGKNHSNDSVVVRFPKEKLLFAVDFAPVNSMAFRDFPDAYVDEWIESLKWLEGMDFDVLVPGHGNLGSKADIRKFRGYLEELRAEVLKYAREGKTLEQMKQLIKMEKYQSWPNYKQYLADNIEGMYCQVQAHRRPDDGHSVHCLRPKEG
jgi:glyoxylase-like metal-dependent hydrolase (beta-lactamase superfamily II)